MNIDLLLPETHVYWFFGDRSMKEAYDSLGPKERMGSKTLHQYGSPMTIAMTKAPLTLVWYGMPLVIRHSDRSLSKQNPRQAYVRG